MSITGTFKLMGLAVLFSTLVSAMEGSPSDEDCVGADYKGWTKIEVQNMDSGKTTYRYESITEDDTHVIKRTSAEMRAALKEKPRKKYFVGQKVAYYQYPAVITGAYVHACFYKVEFVGDKVSPAIKSREFFMTTRNEDYENKCNHFLKCVSQTRNGLIVIGDPIDPAQEALEELCPTEKETRLVKYWFDARDSRREERDSERMQQMQEIQQKVNESKDAKKTEFAKETFEAHLWRAKHGKLQLSGSHKYTKKSLQQFTLCGDKKTISCVNESGHKRDILRSCEDVTIVSKLSPRELVISNGINANKPQNLRMKFDDVQECARVSDAIDKWIQKHNKLADDKKQLAADKKRLAADKIRFAAEQQEEYTMATAQAEYHKWSLMEELVVVN